jgi:DNA ligase-1
MKFISTDDVTEWLARSSDLADFTRTIAVDHREADELLGLRVPLHLQFVIRSLARTSSAPIADHTFDSIGFFSLCKGLFLPLSDLQPEKAAALFGFRPEPKSLETAALAKKLLDSSIGLTLAQKVSCLLGDPFAGRKGGFRRDSLIRLLRTMTFTSRDEVLNRLTAVGDVAVLFAEATAALKSDPPLTALEVLETLRFLPGLRLSRKHEVLRSLFERCGKLEAYYLVKLLLRSAGFGFDYQGPLLAKLLGEKFHVDEDAVSHAMALTDPIECARLLDTEGADGLRRVRLKPLSPIRPALAGGVTTDIEHFPVWVERKYDGIRLLLHKSTDQSGEVLCGAYTRNRGDWLELIPGMPQTIRALPCRDAILDGELYGMVPDLDGPPRPASVYEVYSAIQGEPIRPLQMKFAAFDLLYLNGTDLTQLPLHRRRQLMLSLVQPLAGFPLPVPLVTSEGQLARNKEDLNRLFHHFRSQGYEGIIAKNLEGPYRLATRDPEWVKRKPEITLDLVLLAGVLAVTSKENVGAFGSYVIAARNDAGGFDDVGDVAGLDRVRDQQVQHEVMRLGLLTGRRIERTSSSGTRIGLEFRPALVATVRFEGVIKDNRTGALSLRDPKIVHIRSDKSAHEADTMDRLRELYLDQRLS